MRLMFTGLLSLALALAFTPPVAANVVINEILPNPGSAFDGAEFIELYNTSSTATENVGGWVITGTEFSGVCGGEDHWQIPLGTMLAPLGYIVFAKDNIDTVPGDENDGFLQRFGFDPDFEFFDTIWTNNHDSDDPNVPNLILVSTNSTFDDQVGLWPGVGYGSTCGTSFNRYEALYLYDGIPGGGGTLVDAIEWRDPNFCTADICTGVGTSDDDAFDTFIGVGESLCRDASSTDTGNSRTDLFLGTPTPGIANIANAGPLLSDLTLSNPGPRTSETTDVTITATDTEGIGSMWVVYTVDTGGGPGSPDSVSMSLSATDQYTGTIGPFGDGDIVAYFVRAYDGGNAAGVGFSKFPDYSTRLIRWGTQTIFDVQNSPPTDTAPSPEEGNPVNVEGIVTAENGLYSAGLFVIQSAPGIWNGVHCFDDFATTNVQRGDSVRVSGLVTEYFNRTEIELFGQENVTILASSKPLPGPVLITADKLTTGNLFGETYEGVYVRLENLAVTDTGLVNIPPGPKDWQVTDTFGSCRVGDDGFYLYNPMIADSLAALEGVVDYSRSFRKLEPRDDADVIGPPIVGSVRYAPIPPLGAPSPLTISAEITDFNGTITRAKLYYSVNNGASHDSLDMTNTSGNSYEASLAAIGGPEIDYHIEVTDNDGFNGRAPSIGDYDLYRGLLTIETIQSSTTGTSDSSSYAGSPANCAGIVTMAPGTIADNLFTIQNNYVGDPAYKGIEVFSGGSVVGLIEVGDSVAVSGDVVEYHRGANASPSRKTQIDLHFTDAFTNYGGGFGQPLAYELNTTDLPPDTTGVIPVSEPWESVLVQMTDAVVTNASASFGQYYIDNTVPKTSEETLVDDEARISTLTYVPTLNDNVTIRGIVDFSFDEYKIQPRGDFDILAADPTGVGLEPARELSFALHQSVPNPITGAGTRIAFAVPRATEVKLRVFDVTGRLVRTLVDGPVEAGAHGVDWNGRNQQGQPVSNGVYFYRLVAEGESATRKMILLR